MFHAWLEYTLSRGDLLAEHLEMAQNHSGVSNEQFAGIGELQSAIVSYEEMLSESALERAEALTPRRDGAMGSLCGGREGSGFGTEYRQAHRNEIETSDVDVHSVRTWEGAGRTGGRFVRLRV
jgi:hypothetical protein